jgi:hypothetical protein
MYRNQIEHNFNLRNCRSSVTVGLDTLFPPAPRIAITVLSLVFALLYVLSDDRDQFVEVMVHHG